MVAKPIPVVGFNNLRRKQHYIQFNNFIRNIYKQGVYCS